MNAQGVSPLRPDRLIWRFRKSGAAGAYTMPVNEFDDVRRAVILNGAGLAVDEEPVIACIFGEHLWTVLTTRRLVWKRGGNIGQVSIDDIADATVDPKDVGEAGSKETVRKLTVVTRGQDRHVIELEPGEPFSGFWNVLKTVAATSR